MFTGIIEEIGQVINIAKGRNSATLTIAAKKVLEDVKLGDSIAVNGVCLTASALTNTSFTADVMAETINRSSLGSLKPGSSVNLERAMQLNGRFGGHIVSGHIDSIGTILNQKRDENAVWITIGAPSNVLKYVVEKGSIAIDGVSLTVASVSSIDFKVSVIPHTGKQTTLLVKKVGDDVNLECDVLGKYVEKLMSFKSEKPTSSLSKNFLQENGYL